MIKHADIQDYDHVIYMLKNFANSAPVQAWHDPVYDDRRVRNMLLDIQRNGCVIVATVDNKPAGMLIARVMEDTWLPHIKTLKEMAWWVEPEHRGTTTGYRLLKEYVNTGKRLRDADVIQNFTLTLLKDSPAFDLAKRGWCEVETNYVYKED